MLVLTAFPPASPTSFLARCGLKLGKSASNLSANEGSKKFSIATCLKGSAWRKASRCRSTSRRTASEIWGMAARAGASACISGDAIELPFQINNLFVPQSHHGIEAGGASGWPDAEEQADADRHGDAKHGGPHGDCCGQGRKDQPGGERNQPSEKHAERSAQTCEHHGFGEEI